MTVNNFSIEVQIPDQMWQNFINSLKTDPEMQERYGIMPDVELATIKHKINIIFRQELGRQIKEELKYYCCNDEDTDIAFVSFAYQNAELLCLLIKRGSYLTKTSNCAKKTLEDIDK